MDDNNTKKNKSPKENKSIKVSKKSALLIPVAVLSVAGGYGGSYLEGFINKNSNHSSGSTSIISGSSSTDVNLISQVSDKVSPSVVSIVTKTQTSSRSSLFSGTQEAAGTGIIISDKGYIITNKHVIDGASSIEVVDYNGKSYDASLVGVDNSNDIAFIKVSNPDNFTAAEIGDSSSLKIGEGVVAVGNALGQYQNTVTSGIVSGVGRSVVASSDGTSSNAESLSDLIQTDAAINSGNSGGPLVNSKGQIIGINTAVASDAQGLGFAIPINAAKGMIESVIKTGEVKKAFLGIMYLNITPEVANEFSLSVNSGGYVYSEDGNSVQSGSPADKAGIKNGDIIMSIDGKKIGESGSIGTIIGEYFAGDEITIGVLRDGKEIEIKVTLTEYPTN